MPRSCNIDRRGRRFRATLGIVLLASAALPLAADILPPAARWILAGLLAAFGLFTCYESWAGWCALRAMGYKTRI